MQVDNSNNMTGVNNISPDGLVDGRDIAADGALLDTAEQTANKGVANGYAPLDASALVPLSSLPDSVKTTIPQSFAFTRNNQRYVDTNDDEYETVASPIYPGSDALGIPTTIEANCWNDGGTSISVRIIDLTNGDEVTPVVIAEATGITTSDEFNIEDLGSLSNIPTGSILLGVQLLLTGGGMGDDAAISSLTIK